MTTDVLFLAFFPSVQPQHFPYIHLIFLGGGRAQDHETGAHSETVCVLTGQLRDRDEPLRLISEMGRCCSH